MPLIQMFSWNVAVFSGIRAGVVFQVDGRHESDTSPSRGYRLPRPERQSSGAVDDLARHWPLDYSQREYQWSRDAIKGC
jgi:hypothetical protein